MSPKEAGIDQLYQKRQSRYLAKSAAQDALAAARTALREANEVKRVSHEAKANARDELSAVWVAYTETRTHNSARLEQIAEYKDETESYISSCRQELSLARYRNDNEACWRIQGELNEYYALLKTYAQLREEAIDEIADASALYREKREYFHKMKELAEQADESAEGQQHLYEKSEKDLAKAEAALLSASEELDSLKHQLRHESNERHRFQCELAVRAGIPDLFRNELHLSEGVDGSFHIYYGGIGQPGGEGHGHAVFNTQGAVMYHRPPHSAHGSHNYTKRGYLPRNKR